MKMAIIFIVVGLAFYWWFNKSTPVHVVATGGLPTSNR